MADDLLVGVGADVSEFARDARQIVSIARSLQRDIERALQGTEVIPDLSGDARNAGTQLITGLRNAVQEGGEGLRRDVASALVPTALSGDFTRLATLVRAGTQNISTDLGREGHEAGRALVTGIGSELPAAQQLLEAFVRESSQTLSGRLLTDLTPQGARAGRELVAGLRTSVQAQQGAIRADIVGSLIPTTLAGDFGRLTSQIRTSAATLATALGAGGEDAARELVTGLASGLTGADRVIAQFVGSVSGELDRANLLGDLGRQGELSGSQLVRGVTASITAGAPSIQRAVSTSLVPANLPAQLAVITTGVSREIARITPQLSATGTLAGRALVASLGSELSQGTAVIVREFSRGAAGAVATVDLFGDLTPAGQRAGVQLLGGLTQVVNREGTALRGSLATALIPTTLTGELGRLQTTITAGLREIPPLFLIAGRDAGASFITTLGTQLGESKALLAGFAQDASRLLTSGLTIGDTARQGQVAGQELAASIATGVTSGAPQIREAIATALLPAGVAADVGRVVDTVKAEIADIVPSATATGRATGEAISEGIIAGLAPVGPALRRLTAGETIGIAIDAGPIREATRAQQELTAATEATTAATQGLSRASQQLSSADITAVAADATRLAAAETQAATNARSAAGEFIRAWKAQQQSAQQASQAQQAAAADAQRAAQQETAARQQVRNAFDQDLAALVAYRSTVDATNADAVAQWNRQSDAIRQQARAIGLETDEVYRLDRAIQRAAESLRVQAAEARNAQRSVALSVGPQLGPVLPPNFTRETEAAKRAITEVTIAGRTMSQITNRLGPTLVGVGFGLEALARGGTAAEGGLRTALRAVASFAAFFGPEGLIVSGVAAATAAIIDLFDTARKEVEKTRKEFADQVNQLVRAGDFTGIQKQLRDIEQGVLTLNQQTGKVELTGGLRDLEARADAARRALVLLTAQNRATFDAKTGLQTGGGPFAAVIGENQAVLRQVDSQIAEAKRKQKILTDLLLNPPTLPREITGLPVDKITSGSKDAEKAIRALGEQVNVVREAFVTVNGDVTRQAQILARAIPLYDTIRRAAEAHKGEVSEASNALAKMLRELTDIDAVSIELTRRKLGGIVPDVAPVKLTGIIDKVEVPRAAPKLTVPIDFDAQEMTASLQRSIRAAAAAQNVLDFAKLFGTRQQIADATENVNVATLNLTRTFNAARDAIMQSSDADDVKAAKLKALGQAASEARDLIQSLTTDTADFASTLSDIAGAARGVASVAREIRGVDDDLIRALESAGRFADALSSLSQLKLTGKGGIFSSFGGFLKSIPVIGETITSAIQLGRSIADAITGAAEKAANADILRENNAQLERLREDLRGFDSNIGDLLNIGDVIGRSSILNARLGTSGATRGFKDVEPLDKELRSAGLSVAELKRRAEEFGITITDAKGRITASGLKDLAEASRLAAEALARFKDNLEDTSFIDRARRELFNQTDAASVGKDWLAELKRFAPDLFKKFFAGADSATAEGRAIFRKGLQDVFELAAKNLLPPELLKAFGGVKGLVDFLLDADNALDDLTDTSKALTGEMVNVVRGFRDFNLERARFQATQDTARASITGTLPPQPGLRPVSPFPPTSTTTVGQVVFSPTIRIDGRDKDAVQITTEVVTELRRRAKASANPEVRKTVNLLPA